MQQGIEFCTNAEYNYYCDEHCCINELYEENMYIAMFALKSVQRAIKLPAVVKSIIKNVNNSNLVTVHMEEAKDRVLLIQDDEIIQWKPEKRGNIEQLKFQDHVLSEGFFHSINEHDNIEINITCVEEEQLQVQNNPRELIAC